MKTPQKQETQDQKKRVEKITFIDVQRSKKNSLLLTAALAIAVGMNPLYEKEEVIYASPVLETKTFKETTLFSSLKEARQKKQPVSSPKKEKAFSLLVEEAKKEQHALKKNVISFTAMKEKIKKENKQLQEIRKSTDQRHQNVVSRSSSPWIQRKIKKNPQEKLNEKEQIELLAHLIEAEAKGEPFEGKLAVGQVVINRVESENFPNTLEGVIYQEGQFQPIPNGHIQNIPSQESIKASEQIIRGWRNPNLENVVYFYAPKGTEKENSTWFEKKRVHAATIGNHKFFK